MANGTMDLDGFTAVPGYFGAALLAGLRSGVLPHQSLTNVSMTGVDGVGAAVAGFNAANLDTIAASGGWLVIKVPTGQFVTRDALTSDVSDLNHRTEMVRVNLDSISVHVRDVLSPYVGRANVAPDVLTQMATDLRAGLSSLKAGSDRPLLGSQLVNFELVSIRQHALFRDRVVVTLRLTLPYPANVIESHLVVV